MKTLKWFAYIAVGIGILLVILGSVSALLHVHILQARYIASYFQAANSFFLLTVIIFFYILFIGNKKD